MNARKLILFLMLGAVAAHVAAAADADAPQRGPNAHQVIIESGMVWPGGDLKKDFYQTPQGFGADGGAEIGFRYRYYFRPRFSLSPSFHFVNFGAQVVEDPNLDEYKIRSTSYRYGLELLYQERESAAVVRPFLGVGVGLYRNRLVGLDKNLTTEIDSSANSLGMAVRCGLRAGEFEISAVYHHNRFQTWQFFKTQCCPSYSWDSIGLRLGWSIP